MSSSKFGTDNQEIDQPCCKIGRACQQYGLEDLSYELGERWLDEDDRYSLRELAKFFNRRLIRTAMETVGLNPVEGEPENYRHLLIDEDVSIGSQVQAKNHLEKHGIDVDELKSHFVSHSTVGRHLNECLGLEYAESQQENHTVEEVENWLNAIQSQAETLTEGAITRLYRLNELPTDNYDIFIDVTVRCKECNTPLDLLDLTRGNKCECDFAEE